MSVEPESGPRDSATSERTSGFHSTGPEVRSDSSDLHLQQPRPGVCDQQPTPEASRGSRQQEECVLPSLIASHVKFAVGTGPGPGPGKYPPKQKPYEPPIPGADKVEENGRMSEGRRTSAHSLDEKGACGSDRPHEISSSSPYGSPSVSLVEENNQRDGGHPLQPKRQDRVTSSLSSTTSEGRLSLKITTKTLSMDYSATGSSIDVPLQVKSIVEKAMDLESEMSISAAQSKEKQPSNYTTITNLLLKSNIK